MASQDRKSANQITFNSKNIRSLATDKRRRVWDSENYFGQILSFLGKRNNFFVNKKKFINALNSVEFENLRKLENTKGFGERTSHSSNFFRKGITNEWISEINEDIKFQIEKNFYKEMKQLKYL